MSSVENGASSAEESDRKREAETKAVSISNGAPYSGGAAEEGTLADDFQFDPKTTLEHIRQVQANFSDERNWNHFHTPRNLLLALVGEVGELAELFQWRGECPEGLPEWNAAERTDLEEELSDVLIYLVRLADKCKVNLPQVALRKIEKNKKKYPAVQVYGSSKKYTEYKCNGAKLAPTANPSGDAN